MPIDIDGARFFTPNPGLLYPAIYTLLDQVAAAAKSVRPFTQSRNEGYRCDLTGEAEWLTTDRTQLDWGKTGRDNTLWTRAAKQLPGLLRKGEHLSAVAMLKRMWPRYFVREIASVIDTDIRRYVISTHAMALATSLEAWIERDGGKQDGLAAKLLQDAKTSTALPRRLLQKLKGKHEATRQLAKNLPAWLDEDDADLEARQKEVGKLLDCKPEAYYAFILMDGDKMGAWLSGSEPGYNLTYQQSWHPKIRTSAKGRFPQLDAYLNAERAVSPARHMAISAALNNFALYLARHVVEDLCKGKLLYAGGDDVLAMVSIDDLLRCLFLQRLAYAGIWPEQEGLDALLGILGERDMARLKRGHALLGGKLLRLMGEKATTSAGAVVAHHQTPLGRVLRELRSTEQRAKTDGGRDAFSLNLLKRSGGAVQLTLPWLNPGNTWPEALRGSLTDTPMALLLQLRAMFSGPTSRRAAYLTEGWLTDLPTSGHIGLDALEAMLAANLAQQLQRQGQNAQKEANAALGQRLAHTASLIAAQRQCEPGPLVRDILAVAEFFAREGRTGAPA